VIAGLFEGIDITEQEKVDILGGNAARLFRFQIPVQHPETIAA
jgi:predicted TIM-barrel fold metal-dependent hydrolase